MIVLVMGVTGSGKTTLGRLLADRMELPFYDADDFHPPGNKAKMARDEPLHDTDREPWLGRLASEIAVWAKTGGAVLACSALKQRYRDKLLVNAGRKLVLYLKIDKQQLLPRLELRKDHAFVRDYRRIVDAQYRDLEAPSDAVVLAAERPLEELVEQAAEALLASGYSPQARDHR